MSFDREFPLYLVTLTHSSLAEPLRVVNDNQDIMVGGQNYQKYAFLLDFPDQPDTGDSTAYLVLDNVGSAITTPIDNSGGAHGMEVNLKVAFRSDPNTLLFDYTMQLSEIEIDDYTISAALLFDDAFGECFPVVYNATTARAMY